MPRTADFSNLPHEALLGAVQHLVARKRLTPQEVRAAADRATRIAELERQLAVLKGNGARRGPGRPPGPARRKMTMTPKASAARKLQGQYLGRLKKLKGADRTKVRAVAKRQGVAEAVKLANEILRA